MLMPIPAGSPLLTTCTCTYMYTMGGAEYIGTRCSRLHTVYPSTTEHNYCDDRREQWQLAETPNTGSIIHPCSLSALCFESSVLAASRNQSMREGGVVHISTDALGFIAVAADVRQACHNPMTPTVSELDLLVPNIP